jgi:hypothetical protein
MRVVVKIAEDMKRLPDPLGSNQQLVARLLDIDDDDKPSVDDEADAGVSYPV